MNNINKNSVQKPLFSVVLPTYNESDGITLMINGLIKFLPDDTEIIIVDDNSTDSTVEQIKSINDNRIQIVSRTTTKGLASAILRGLLETQGDIIIWMDADALMVPPLLPDMIESLKTYDIVIASRYVDGGRDDRDKIRVLASRLINGWAAICLGRDVKDYTSNYIAFHRSVFNSILPMPFGFGEFFIEFVYRASRKGLSIYEIPVTVYDRQHGVSKAFGGIMPFLWLGMKYFIRIIWIKITGRAFA